MRKYETDRGPDPDGNPRNIPMFIFAPVDGKLAEIKVWHSWEEKRAFVEGTTELEGTQ